VTWSLNNTDTDWIPKLAQGVSAYGDFTGGSFGVFTTTVGPIDASLVFVNTYASEAFDLTTWKLSDEQESMILSVANNFNNTIVVMNSGNSMNVEAWADHENITAIIWQGFAGQNSGENLVEILYGDKSPSASLPFTWGHNLSDYPAQVSNASTVNYTEGLYLDYRWFDEQGIEPRWPFGHGLTYTTFEWKDADVSSSLESSSSTASKRQASSSSSSNDTSSSSSSNSDIKLSGSVWKSIPTPQSDLNETAFTLSFTVSNTGTTSACASSQLYLGFPEVADEPPRLLKGFEKTCLGEGENGKVEIVLKRKDVSYFDVDEDKWLIPEGTFNYYLGPSSRDLRLNGTFSS